MLIVGAYTANGQYVTFRRLGNANDNDRLSWNRMSMRMGLLPFLGHVIGFGSAHLVHLFGVDRGGFHSAVHDPARGSDVANPAQSLLRAAVVGPARGPVAQDLSDSVRRWAPHRVRDAHSAQRTVAGLGVHNTGRHPRGLVTMTKASTGWRVPVPVGP